MVRYLKEDVDMTESYISEWVVVDDGNNLSTNGFVIQLAWEDYVTTGDNATVKVYGSIDDGETLKSLLVTYTINSASNLDDVLIIAINDQHSKVHIDYDNADCSAGSMNVIIRQARR